MASFLKNHKIEIVLLAVSLFAHFFFFFLLLNNYGPDSFYATNEDAAEYFTLGKNLYWHQAFSSFDREPFYLNSFRTILYPLYLSFFQLFSAGAWLPMIFQNIFASFSAVAMYWLGRLVVGNKKAPFVAALIFALNPLQNYWANIAEPDTLLVFLFLISLVLFVKYRHSNLNRYLYWSAFVLGLCVLTKPVAVYFPFFFLSFIFIHEMIFRRSGRKLIKPAMIFLAIVFLTVSPWFFRNWYHFRVFSLSSLPSMSYVPYAAALGPLPEELTDYLQWVKNEYGQEGQNKDGSRDIRAKSELIRMSLKVIFSRPVEYSKHHLIGMVQFYLNDGHKEAYYNQHYKAMLWFNVPDSDSKFGISEQLRNGNWKVIFEVLKKPNQYVVLYFISKIIYLLMYLAALYGLWRSYKSDKKLFGFFLFLLSFFAYISVAAGPWGSCVRYRLPVLPGVLIVSAYGLFQIFRIKPSPKSKLLMITRKIDPRDALAGFAFNWAKKIGENLDELHVVSWQKGDRGDLPENIKVIFLPDSKFKKVLVLEKELFKILPKVNGVFCHMNPEYAILAGFPAKIFRKRIVSWYTHKTVSWRRRIVEILADKILTASPESFRNPWFKDKVAVTGHGIDLNMFKPEGKKENDFFEIVSVGRISPTKDYESIIKAVDILNDKKIKLRIIGDVILESQRAYLKELEAMTEKMDLNGQVEFAGWVANKDLAPYYQQSDLFISMSGTGSVDKAVLEAMACGCLVLTSNEAFKRILPPELMAEKNQPEKLAERIKYLKNLPLAEKQEIKKDLRKEVADNHNLDNLAEKIVSQFS